MAPFSLAYARWYSGSHVASLLWMTRSGCGVPALGGLRGVRTQGASTGNGDQYPRSSLRMRGQMRKALLAKRLFETEACWRNDEIQLARNGGEEVGVEERLELAVVALVVDAEAAAVGVDRHVVDGVFLDRACTHLAIHHAGLDQG